MSQPGKTQVSVLFLIITCLFVTCLLITNIVAGRLIEIAGIPLTADLFLFPIVYIFGDVLTEVYGFRRARLTIWIGFSANFLMALFFIFVIQLPFPDYWEYNEAYNAVLGFTPRLVIASLAAYFFGEFTNSMILSRMKIWTKGRWLWTRTIASTLIGQGVDTVLFMAIAFGGSYTIPILLAMIGGQYMWKVGYEVIATPLTYGLVGWLKKQENLDTYDRNISYNPFRLT